MSPHDRWINHTFSLVLIAGVLGGLLSWHIMVHPIIAPDFSAPAIKLSTFLLWMITPLAGALSMLGTILVMAGIINRPQPPRVRIAPIVEEVAIEEENEFADWDARFRPLWRESLKRHDRL